MSLPTPCRIVATKQSCLLGGHKEVGETIEKLVKVNIIRMAYSPCNFPLCPVQKQDGTWHMTVDYREPNKVIPSFFAAMSWAHTIMY